MLEFTQKLKEFAEIIHKDKKTPFSLLGVFRNSEIPVYKWDLVFSASWIKQSNSYEDLKYIINYIKASKLFIPEEMVKVNRIVLLRPEEDFVQMCNSRFPVKVTDKVKRISPFANSYNSDGSIDSSISDAIIIISEQLNQKENSYEKKMKSLDPNWQTNWSVHRILEL